MAAPAAGRSRPAGRWLVCLGAARDVLDGRVACPLASEAVDAATCRACHLLVTIANERDPDADCLMPVMRMAGSGRN